MTRRKKGPAAVKKRATTPLTGILRTLGAFYGKPAPPEATDPLGQILYENVAYLASDARRRQAFYRLKELTGLKPDRILGAPGAALHGIGRRGILPAELPSDCGVLIQTYQLLRSHGQELCKTNRPRCEACPVRAECLYFKTV